MLSRFAIHRFARVVPSPALHRAYSSTVVDRCGTPKTGCENDAVVNELLNHLNFENTTLTSGTYVEKTSPRIEMRGWLFESGSALRPESPARARHTTDGCTVAGLQTMVVEVPDRSWLFESALPPAVVAAPFEEPPHALEASCGFGADACQEEDPTVPVDSREVSGRWLFETDPLSAVPEEPNIDLAPACHTNACGCEATAAASQTCSCTAEEGCTTVAEDHGPIWIDFRVQEIIQKIDQINDPRSVRARAE